MTQIDHYIFSFILGLITWYGFWGPLFLKLTTPEEYEYWDKKTDEWISKL